MRRGSRSADAVLAPESTALSVANDDVSYSV